MTSSAHVTLSSAVASVRLAGPDDSVSIQTAPSVKVRGHTLGKNPRKLTRDEYITL